MILRLIRALMAYFQLLGGVPQLPCKQERDEPSEYEERINIVEVDPANPDRCGPRSSRTCNSCPFREECADPAG